MFRGRGRFRGRKRAELRKSFPSQLACLAGNLSSAIKLSPAVAAHTQSRGAAPGNSWLPRREAPACIQASVWVPMASGAACEVIDLCDSDSEGILEVIELSKAGGQQPAAAAAAADDDEVQFIEPESLKPKLNDVELGDDEDIAIVGSTGEARRAPAC